MDYKYINQLLERYWKCETSLEEEQILRTFFCQDNVPAELRQYKSLFAYEVNEPKEDTLGHDFDERMAALVSDPEPVKAVTVTLGQRFAPLFKAAAVVAIFLTLGNAAQFTFNSDDSSADMATPAQKASHGASVALGDSMKVDTAKQGTLDAAQTKGTFMLK